MSKRGKPGLSKAIGYKTGIFCMEYDLHGMIVALNGDLSKLLELAELIKKNPKLATQWRQRWSATETNSVI